MRKVGRVTWETRLGEGSRPSTHRRMRSGRESERSIVLLKPGNAGGGKGPHFWVLSTELWVGGLA